jgi:hypothetical protein
MVKSGKESCTSPKTTARFSSFPGAAAAMLKASKAAASNNKQDGNISRENIKMNTKNLMHEISDLDLEIA